MTLALGKLKNPMRFRYRRALITVLSVLVCSSAALVSMWAPLANTRTEDLNHDGRPDIWRSYARDGRIARVAVDTNFDGRSDVQEFYENGALIRRESDRDFDNQIDLVQDFDQTTHKIIRSVVDVNADGVADLLVLFQDGRLVYSKWARASRPVATSDFPLKNISGRSDLPPVSFVDPFTNDPALGAIHVSPGTVDFLGLPVPVGMPEVGDNDAGSAHASSSIAFNDRSASPTLVGPSSLRGPPALHVLS
jgi:hypothetical protein